jgi:hypothetical protein
MIFGPNTFAARLPFAILGILSVLAFYFLSKRVSGQDRVARLATVFLICSAPFLLWNRQCHWYGPVILFSILIALTYLKFFETPNIKTGAAFVLASSGLFYSNFMYLPGMTLALVVYTLWQGDKKDLIRLIHCEIAILLIAAPWIVYPLRVFRQSTHCLFPGLSMGAGAVWHNFTIYFWKINTFFMPFIALLSIWLVSYLVWGRGKTNEINKSNPEIPDKRKLVLLIVVSLLLTALPFYPYPWALIRWLMPSLPFYLLLTAIVVNKIIGYQKIVGYALVGLLLFTNVLNTLPYSAIKLFNIRPSAVETFVKSPHAASIFFIPSLYGYINYEQKFRSFFYEYITGLFHDYRGRTKGVVEYLRKYGKKGDKVLVQTLEAEPIMFYTDLTIVNQLHPEFEGTPLGDAFQIQSTNADKFYKLTQASYEDIDWIITGRYALINMEIWDEFNDNDFEKIYIDAPDIFFESNPDIDSGPYFKTLKEAPGFYIFHRKGEGAKKWHGRKQN